MRPIIPDFVKGEVRLPASKSISNRVLILDALSGHQVDLQNLSDSDDTRVLRQFLQSPVRRVDVGLAGTAMRFLAAFLAARQGTWELTGSPRMCQRPMAPLVEALNALGARVGYVATPGCPPLCIEGMPLAGGEIEMPACQQPVRLCADDGGARHAAWLGASFGRESGFRSLHPDDRSGHA